VRKQHVILMQSSPKLMDNGNPIAFIFQQNCEPAHMTCSELSRLHGKQPAAFKFTRSKPLGLQRMGSDFSKAYHKLMCPWKI